MGTFIIRFCEEAAAAAMARHVAQLNSGDGGGYVTSYEWSEFWDPYKWPKINLGGGNSNICYFHPLSGEDSHFDFCIFFRWVVQPPTSKLGN